MSRQSNKLKMTGRKLELLDGKPIYPWHNMETGDWFYCRSNSAVIACIRNKNSDAKYASVLDLNVIVRVK